MSFDGYRSLEWASHNLSRSYPLTTSASGVSTDGLFRLDNSYLGAVYLHIPWDRDADITRFFLSRVVVFGTSVRYEIAYKPPSGPSQLVAYSQRDIPEGSSNLVVPLVASAEWPDVAGSIVYGSWPSHDYSSATGIFDLTYEAGQLEPDCIRPSAKGISAIRIVDGSQYTHPLTGLIELRAGQNIRFRVSREGDVNVVRIDAIDNSEFTDDCECAGPQSPCIRTVNDVRPSPDGNITLTPSRCIELTPGSAEIRIGNPCSEPCCGCQQTAELTEAMTGLTSRLVTLESVVNILNTTASSLQPLLTGGQIPDGCPVSPNSQVFDLSPP
jgi:hypothetical protein